MAEVESKTPVREGYKQTEIGEIPESWEVHPLSALTKPGCSITYGVVKPGPHDPQGVLFIRGGDFPDGVIQVKTLRTITAAVDAQYSRTRLEGGEVLISLVGQPGSSTEVPCSLAGANVARQVAVVRPNDSIFSAFLRAFISCPSGQEALLFETLGSVQQVINLQLHLS
jgi:type I restriction enzyme, S subunit